MMSATCPNNDTHNVWYADAYDRFACMICDIWTENVCNCDHDCAFMKAFIEDSSPIKPSDAKIIKWSDHKNGKVILDSVEYHKIVMELWNYQNREESK